MDRYVYTPVLICLLARDMGDTGQGHLTVDGGPEIGTGGLWLCQLGLACLARGLALTNKRVLDCILTISKLCDLTDHELDQMPKQATRWQIRH